jgi:LPS sulfotransferase NodH
VSPSGYFSTKLAIDQLVWLARTGVIPLQLRNPHFVHVVRRNVVAQAVSLSIARQTRQWTSLHSRRRAEPRYDSDEILRAAHAIVRANSLFELFFELHSISPLRLIYEDVSERPNLVADRFSAHFSVVLADPKEQALRLTKQGTELNEEWERRFRRKYPLLGNR